MWQSRDSDIWASSALFSAPGENGSSNVQHVTFWFNEFKKEQNAKSSSQHIFCLFLYVTADERKRAIIRFVQTFALK